jgi:hypothetical protein
MSDSTNTGLNGMNMVMGMVMADREGLDKTEGFKASLLTSFGSVGGGYLQNFLPMYLLLQAKGGETRANANIAAKDDEIARLREALASAERDRDDFKTRLDRCKQRHPDCDCISSSVSGPGQQSITAEANASAGDTKAPKTGKGTEG